MTEQWTTTQAAAHGGMKRDSFTRELRRNPDTLRPVGRQTGAKGEYLFDADAVRAWYASRPGQGTRTDLRNAEKPPTPGPRVGPGGRGLSSR